MRSLACTAEPQAEAIQFDRALDHMDDMNFGGSMATMELLNEIRADYARQD
jgi:hypothetical protein